MDRLLLVRHGPTASTRRAAFPADEPQDVGGARDSVSLRSVLGAVDAAFSSPALRARQTAEAFGLSAERDPDLAECDFGCWAMLTLEEVHARDPEGLRAWFEDPHAAPHGGETEVQMAERVRRFLERVGSGTTVAVTHGGVVKATLIEVLGAPRPSFWRIDIAPASITELRRRHGMWTIARTNWTVS